MQGTVRRSACVTGASEVEEKKVNEIVESVLRYII